VNYNLQDEDWFIAYEAALYWAVQTMTTIGYGDVSPQTKIERLIGVVFLLIASFVFAYTMNSIGAAL
jgi:potassium voltage-gated channel Eag-related subfamily H protein 5